MIDMKKSVVVFLLLLVLSLSTFVSASAVTDGNLDGDGHPYVGLLIFDRNGSPAWRCSGTLLSPTWPWTRAWTEPSWPFVPKSHGTFTRA